MEDASCIATTKGFLPNPFFLFQTLAAICGQPFP